jgi:soluble cytochrome b562
MPKLDGTHIADRLKRRLDELLRGEEVAARDMKSLLTEEQQVELENAKNAMKILKNKKRARTREEESALGWKTKREIHIEALTQALNAAQEGELAAWKKKMHDADVRQGRVYFDELKAEIEKGVDAATAKTRANNALTRAGLKRLDGAMIGTQGLNKRDREIRDLEDAIQQKNESELDDYEREQLELLREHEKAVLENSKKRGK